MQIRQTDPVRRNQSQPKFRHDENILESQPVTHRAITIPEEGKGSKEYVSGNTYIYLYIVFYVCNKKY